MSSAIAVMGTGGIGGYFGALLAQAGNDVTFIARGAHLAAIQARGLRVERANGKHLTITPAMATDDPVGVGPVDLVLLSVKTYDVPAALASMRPLVGPQTAVVTLQNGIESHELVAEAFGQGVVLPALVYSELAVKAPGVIFQGAPFARIVLGELDGQESGRARTIADTLRQAGIDITISPNILSALWSKFCFICAMSGVTSLARQPLGPLLADDEGRALLQAVMEEVRAVGLATGVRFDADPVETGIAAAERFNPESKSSMLRDLERGRRLEVEALNGAVVRLGRRVGVPTPVNHTVYAALRFAQPQA